MDFDLAENMPGRSDYDNWYPTCGDLSPLTYPRYSDKMHEIQNLYKIIRVGNWIELNLSLPYVLAILRFLFVYYGVISY